MRTELNISTKLNSSRLYNKTETKKPQQPKSYIQQTSTDMFVKNVSFTGLNHVAQRAKIIVDVPSVLKSIKGNILKSGAPTTAVKDADEIKKLFPHTYGQPEIKFEKPNAIKKVFNRLTHKHEPHNVGVIFSGGPASGGHNVISGLFDGLKELNPKSKLLGFQDGPSGLIEGKFKVLDEKIVDKYRNLGGFDMIGTGRTKLSTEDQFEEVLKHAKKNKLDSIVVIGGDDSNTNAAVLAEWFAKKGEKINVVGCPKTIDGDLKTPQIEISFGHDTSTKTYSQTVAAIQNDARSAGKYWHLIKAMGRTEDFVVSEIALQTHPNVVIIANEVAKKGSSLNDVVNDIAEVIVTRERLGKNYGTVLIPEGLLEFIPEMGKLISKINDIMPSLKGTKSTEKIETVVGKLGQESSDAKLFKSLPSDIKEQLLAPRDSHGNLTVSQIDTEKLLIQMLKSKLQEMKALGVYNGTFKPISHFLGYEGRSCTPTKFDTTYCNALGKTAAALIDSGKTGYMATVSNLEKPVKEWSSGGTPMTSMFNIETRHGKPTPVIQKAHYDLDGPVHKTIEKQREYWALRDDYKNPGAIQYNEYEIPETLRLEREAAKKA